MKTEPAWRWRVDRHTSAIAQQSNLAMLGVVKEKIHTVRRSAALGRALRQASKAAEPLTQLADQRVERVDITLATHARSAVRLMARLSAAFVISAWRASKIASSSTQ